MRSMLSRGQQEWIVEASKIQSQQVVQTIDRLQAEVASLSVKELEQDAVLEQKASAVEPTDLDDCDFELGVKLDVRDSVMGI